MKTLAVIRYTVKETLLHKVTLAVCGGLALLIAIVVFGVHIVARDGRVQELGLPGGIPFAAADLAGLLPQIVKNFVTLGYQGILLLFVVATARIIPDSLNDGTVGIFLARPVSRTSVLFGRYIGVVLAVGIVATIALVVFWVVLAGKGVETGWTALFLLPGLVISFASTFAYMTLIGIVTRSGGLGAAFAAGHVFLLSDFLATPDYFLPLAYHGGALRLATTAARILLPQVAGMRYDALAALGSGSLPLVSLTASCCCGLAALLLAAMRFRHLDF